MFIAKLRRRLVVAATAVTAAVGVLGGAQAAQAKTPPPPAYVPPPIVWGTCDNPTLVAFGAQCGDLIVPLDYANPGGTKITLAVSRVLHSTPDSQYQGVMLVNPGGPGGSGRIYSILGAFVPNGGGDPYDWIGFDPRGVGSSRPALSCDPDYAAGPREPYRPANRHTEPAWLDNAQAYAEACGAAGGELLNHLRTTDNAADMDSLRIALGQQQINYYGFSYGTYLGQVYATLYPNRVRRMVFDGTVDPTRVFYQSNQDQDVAFQKTFEIYFEWLARYDDVYHVGATAAEVRDRYLAAIDELDAHPADGVFGGDELTDVFTAAGYYVYGWEDIANAWSAYVNQNDASGLEELYGTPSDDNSYAMYLATTCTDAPWPSNQHRLDSDNWRLDRNYNYLTWANAWFNGPCASWPVAGSKPVKVDGRKLDVPILMIGETFDAATPFSGSLVVRRLFPTASLIEGVDGSTHAGSLSGVSCTDDTIAAYLLTGAVPTRQKGNTADLECPPVPQPEPATALAPMAAAKVGSTAAAPTPALRRELAVKPR